MSNLTVEQGDCLLKMAALDADSIDAIVTDPPYGLSQHKPSDVEDCLRAWLAGEAYSHGKRGFMGKGWDGWVPGPNVWREAYRVLKPGGHMLVFAGSRTQDLMGLGLRLAGFEIRDVIQWLYGCVDDKTEILTNEGWMDHAQVAVNQKALCFRVSDGTFEWGAITDVPKHDYDDQAFRLEGSRGHHIVSRGHRCVVKHTTGFRIEAVESLARKSEVRIPILENLPKLLHDFPLPHEGAGAAKQDMRPELCGAFHQQYQESDTSAQSAFVEQRCSTEPQVQLQNMRYGVPFKQETRCEENTHVLFRELSREGPSGSHEGSCPSWACRLDGGKSEVLSEKDDRPEQPRLEGRGDISASQGQLQAGQMCPLPAGVQGDVSVKRVRCGASIAGSTVFEAGAHESRDGSSCEPRLAGQPAGEPDVVHLESGSQTVRAPRSTSSDLVRITTEHYKGVMWCVTVPTGAFVARRNGMVFVTGNSGFPKSLNIGKAIDKQRYNPKQVLQVTAWIASARDEAGLTNREIDQAFGFTGMAGHWTSQKTQSSVPTLDQVPRLLDILGVAAPPVEIGRLLYELNGRKGEPGKAWSQREVLRKHPSPASASSMDTAVAMSGGWREAPTLTKPATDAAKQWEGWGTALKPAYEPIIIVRKPLIGTVAANVLEHGTGGINIDGSRIGGAPSAGVEPQFDPGTPEQAATEIIAQVERKGRWPANVILQHQPGCQQFGTEKVKPSNGSGVAHGRNASAGDVYGGGKGFIVQAKGEEKGGFVGEGGTERVDDWDCAEGCPVAALDEQSGMLGSFRPNRKIGQATNKQMDGVIYGKKIGTLSATYKDKGGASRFFYCAKASTSEKAAGLDDKCPHPTVKPLALMRHLVKLITPPGGLILDPFTGSGSTGCAAVLEGFQFIGFELDSTYVEIANQRIDHWAGVDPTAKPKPKVRKAPKPEIKEEVDPISELFGFSFGEG